MGETAEGSLERHEKPNVLLLVIDSCRADFLPPSDETTWKAPHSWAFAEEGTVFTRNVSPAPWTLPSMTSILTGLYPHEHGATSRQFAMQRGRTIAERLADAGYRCIHVSPKTWIGPWLPQGRGFHRTDEFTGPEHRRFDDGDDVRTLSAGVSRGPEWYSTVLKRALASSAPLESLGNALAYKLSEATGDAWRDDVRASERAAQVADRRFDELAGDDAPFFMYVHLMDPHLPFYVPSEFRSDVRPPGCTTYEEEIAYVEWLRKHVWDVRLGNHRLSPDERTYLRTRYADEVAYADHVVGKILASLAAHGLADETLVALTADHGEHLGEDVGGATLVDHQLSVRLPVVRTPLALRFPGVFEVERRDDLVQTHYLAETVAALAGLEHNPSRSLLPADRNAVQSTVLSEYAGIVPSHPPPEARKERFFLPRRTALVDSWQLTAVDDEIRAARVDWAANEATEIEPEEIPPAQRAQLRARLRTATPTAGEPTTSIPSDVEQNLRNLGYL